MIIDLWNEFVSVNSSEEQRKMALQQIHYLKGADLMRIAKNIFKQLNRGQQVFQPEDILQSTYQRLITANLNSVLPPLHSDTSVLSYIRTTMRNSFNDHLRRNVENVELNNDIDFIDDFKGFEIRNLLIKFAKVKRGCSELLERRGSGYTYADLINIFPEYRNVSVGALTQRFAECRRAFSEFLNC